MGGLNDLRELRDGIDPEVPKPKGERGSKKFGFLNQLRERKEWRARHEESSNPGLTRRYWFYTEGVDEMIANGRALLTSIVRAAIFSRT